MKPTFYPRLAWMGIKKNARLYVPYLLSCAFMAAMLYVIAYLAVTPALYTVNGKVNGSGTSAVAMTMSLGSFVVSVFIALFLFYTNSFLLRRRKKEFGLYSVLGMDRGGTAPRLRPADGLADLTAVWHPEPHAVSRRDRRGAASFRAALLRDVPPDVECVFPHRQHRRCRGVTRFTI